MGALHESAVPHYVAVLRRVQELGGFHHLFYVTHEPDAALLADAQLHFANGAISLELPPFVADGAAV